MSEIITYLRCASAPISPNTIGAIGAATYSQQLTFSFASGTPATYNSQYFSKYNGDGVQPLYRFPIASNSLIKSIRLSIPNLPGARWAINPDGAQKLIRQGFKIGVAGFENPPVAPINAAEFYVGINELNTWTEINQLINANDYLTDGINTAVYYYISFGAVAAGLNQLVYVDFRNYQTAFDNINIYMLAEMQIIAPGGVL